MNYQKSSQYKTQRNSLRDYHHPLLRHIEVDMVVTSQAVQILMMILLVEAK